MNAKTVNKQSVKLEKDLLHTMVLHPNMIEQIGLVTTNEVCL